MNLNSFEYFWLVWVSNISVTLLQTGAAKGAQFEVQKILAEERNPVLFLMKPRFICFMLFSHIMPGLWYTRSNKCYPPVTAKAS